MTTSVTAAFPNGISSGDVTQTSAVLWTRAVETGPLTFQIATDPSFTRVSSPGGGCGGLNGVRRRRRAPGSHVAGVAPDACRHHGTATRGRPPGNAGQMGGRDRAVHPATGTAHGRGTHRGRVAGRRWARHAGVPGPDAAPGLAGVPLDDRARSVPAAGLGCCAVRHCPARVRTVQQPTREASRRSAMWRLPRTAASCLRAR